MREGKERGMEEKEKGEGERCRIYKHSWLHSSGNLLSSKMTS